MRSLLVVLTLVAVCLPGVAQAEVGRADAVSERPDSVAIVVYPDAAGAYGGLVLVRERRTVTLPAGPVRLDLRDVAPGIVAQTVAVEGLAQPVSEQNFDYRLLSPASLLERSQGLPVRLVRTLPGGKVEEQHATVVASAHGVLVDVQGRIEALQCSGLPERIVLDVLPPGFTAKPTLSVETISPKAGRRTLTLSYLATGVSWKATYVARLRGDGGTLDMLSWVTLQNRSAAAFPDAAVQVLAGTLQRSGDTRPAQMRTSRFAPDCWRIDAGRTAAADFSASQRDLLLLAPAPPPPPPPRAPMAAVAPPPRPSVENIGDYKLYTLPEATTVAAFQTKQVSLFEVRGAPYRRTFRRTMNHAGGPVRATTPVRADGDDFTDQVITLANDKAAGLGMALPAGAAEVFEAGPGGVQMVREDRVIDTAIGLPLELALGPSTLVEASAKTALRVWDEAAKRWRSDIEVTLTNATGAPVSLDIRENGSAAGFRVLAQSQPSTSVAGCPAWRIAVPAHGEARLTYSLEWQ